MISIKNVTTYTSFEQLPVMLNADQLSAVLGISRAGTYVLLHTAGFPVVRIGKRMVIPKIGLIDWLEKNSSNHIWR